MATFPESPVPSYPLTIGQEWRTIKTGMDSGYEERTAKWLFPKYNVTVRYGAISATNAQTLWNFYLARKGSYEAFYIYDLSLLKSITKAHTDQYIGTGDGVTEVFDIPGRSTSSQTIYIDSVAQTVTTDYVILTGGGTSSSDRVDFVTPPDLGTIITANFSGYLRMRVRFADDNMSQDLFFASLYTCGLSMKGLAAA